MKNENIDAAKREKFKINDTINDICFDLIKRLTKENDRVQEIRYLQIKIIQDLRSRHKEIKESILKTINK